MHTISSAERVGGRSNTGYFGVACPNNEQMDISLHAKVQGLWLDKDNNTSQECLQTCTMSTTLMALSLFN